jgi:hypothetical protein
MNTWKRGVGVVLVVALAVAGWMYLRRDRDEARLRRALAELAAWVEKKAPESPLAAGGTADRIARQFSESGADLIIQGLPSLTSASRAEIRSAVFQFRHGAEHLSVSVRDVEVTLAEDRTRARMTFVVSASLRMAGGEERGVREVRMDWAREEEGWRIRRIEADEGLRRI